MKQSDIDKRIVEFNNLWMNKKVPCPKHFNAPGLDGQCTSGVANFIEYVYGYIFKSMPNAKNWADGRYNDKWEIKDIKYATKGCIIVSTTGTYGHVMIGAGNYGQGKGVFEQNSGWLHTDGTKDKTWKQSINKNRTYGQYCLIYKDLIKDTPAEKPQGAIYHIVVKGETLSAIAKRYKSTWQKIYEDNKTVIGSNPNLIKVGTKLIIK